MRHFIRIVVLSACLVQAGHAAQGIIRDSQDMECHVYTPERIDPEVTYQLVVGVHGAGRSSGKGAGGMAGWAQRGDVIVIGPAFQTKGERPYQNGDGVHAEKLIKLFEQLGKTYKLRDKMFLHGFSGGSQFAHRFAMNHPELVCGVSAHSGGSWATDGFGRISDKAKSIPFAISCGANDTGKAWGTAPYDRLTWFGRFRDEIDRRGFCHAATSWPGVGHRHSPGVQDLARECFQLATGLPGKSATEPVQISGLWKHLKEAPQGEAAVEAGPARPYVDPHELERMTGAAMRMAGEAQIEDDKLVHFMTRYPPVLWKDKDGAATLLAQCTRAALAWRSKAVEADAFKGENLRRFEAFSNGLTLPPVSR